MKDMKRIIATVALAVAGSWNLAHAAAPVITSVEAAPDGGIIIRWSSEADKIYRIDFAPVLTQPVKWRELYTDYPSHGTTTFWKDVGNEFAFPPAGHPQDSAMRFYRVVEIAANSASKPTVSITSPAQSATVSGDITVTFSISSSLPVESVRLFVDGGEAALRLASATEFPLNTCEFPNGERTLLAVVRNASGGETTEAVTAYVENVAPSALRTLTFQNYISQFRVSRRVLDPAESETARFVAQFGGYSDWTLRITNTSGVAVRTVTGTDFRLNFLWDGRGDGGAPLPVAYYGAELSAAPSAQSPPAPGGGGAEEGGGPPGPASARQAFEMGLSSYFIKPPPMPPIKKGDKWFPWEEVFGPLPPIEVKLPEGYAPKAAAAAGGGGNAFGPEAQGQTTGIGPIRVGLSGSFAIAYQGHHPQGTVFPASTAPDDGLIGTIELNTASPAGSYPKLRSLRNISLGLESVLSRAGFRLVNRLADDDLTLNHLDGVPYGGRGTLNEANLAFLCGHGVYGKDPDFTISFDGPLQTYYPVYRTGNNFYDWFRISNGDFGGSFLDVNNVVHPGRMRWMCILTCNNLHSDEEQDTYGDMYNKEVLPITDDLHLLLGCKTTSYMVSAFGAALGHALTGTFVSPTPQLSVAEAWFYAGRETQARGNPSQPVVFRVAGWPNNFSDFLDNYQTPNAGNPADITFEDRQVWP
jgi:hypothetical protein